MKPFPDRLDFSKFLAEYEACHMNYVRMKFAEAQQCSAGPCKRQTKELGVRMLGTVALCCFNWQH